jgi:hypothetical protein
MAELIEVRIYPRSKEGDYETARMRFPEGFGGGEAPDLTELQDAVSAVQTEVGNLQAVITSPASGDVEGTYPNLTVPYMAQLQIQITNLEGLIQTLEGRVAALESA